MKGSSYFGGKVGTAQVLNSPWDVVIDPSGSCLYFAMAGQHQIWRYDLASGVTGALGVSCCAGQTLDHAVLGLRILPQRRS